MKVAFLLITLVSCAFPAAASIICHKSVESCVIYVDEAGAIFDRNTNQPITKIGNVSAFSGIAIYKYGEQYALVQENSSSDRLVTVIPLRMLNNAWRFKSVYYFSISLAASSAKSRPLWSGSKIAAQETKVGNDVLDRAGDLPSKYSRYIHIPSGWPSTNLYVSLPVRSKAEASNVLFRSTLKTVRSRSVKLHVPL